MCSNVIASAMTVELFEIQSSNKHTRRPGLAPGPITTGGDVARGRSGSPFKNEQRWLWVPAQGRDDDKCRDDDNGRDDDKKFVPDDRYALS
jgi:hypothetical protein